MRTRYHLENVWASYGIMMGLLIGLAILCNAAGFHPEEVPFLAVLCIAIIPPILNLKIVKEVEK